MQQLRTITTWAAFKAEPESTQDILFGYGMHAVKIEERGKRLMWGSAGLASISIMQVYLMASGNIPGWLNGTSQMLCILMLVGAAGLMVVHANDLWKQLKAIHWIGRELGIDVRRFNLDRLERSNEGSIH